LQEKRAEFSGTTATIVGELATANNTLSEALRAPVPPPQAAQQQPAAQINKARYTPKEARELLDLLRPIRSMIHNKLVQQLSEADTYFRHWDTRFRYENSPDKVRALVTNTLASVERVSAAVSESQREISAAIMGHQEYRTELGELTAPAYPPQAFSEALDEFVLFLRFLEGVEKPARNVIVPYTKRLRAETGKFMNNLTGEAIPNLDRAEQQLRESL
jgi:hypothetical protein